MGVLGLTPFLQKTCPKVIKQLPDRLRGLTGKTIVIDGTLITQRLHFAAVPHQFRHVLGWYRLVKELKDCGVMAICVFDGKERSLAKTREAERRKQVQRMTVARGTIEVDRLKRLRKLVGLFHEFRSLPSSERERVTSELRPMVWDTYIPLMKSGPHWHPGNNPDLEHIQDSIELTDMPTTAGQDVDDFDLKAWMLSPDRAGPVSSAFAAAQHPPPSSSEERAHSIDLDEPLPPPPSDNGLEFYLSSEGYISIPPIAPENYPGVPKRLRNINDSACLQSNDTSQSGIAIHDQPMAKAYDDAPSIETPVFSDIQPDITSEDMCSSLTSLYLDYRHSIPKLASLSPPYLAYLPSDPNEVHTEYAITKSQYQLTLDEGKLWEGFAGSPDVILDESCTEAMLASLAEKSSLMSDSYQRRSNPPTTQTYDESREILQALGVPCLESTGPFEAEALASSLVINGSADYVASEDTDVLIYGAPMIRNITNRQGPLLFVSGTETRAALQLDRARYVDFALLLGTDFSQRIKNVGPTRALKFIREHGSIERVLELETKYPPRLPAQTYLKQIEAARIVFDTLPPVPDPRLLQSRETDDNAVQEILERYRLHRLVGSEWDYNTALVGNYFEDNPSAM